MLGENRDSQLELPGTYGLGLSRNGLMFCSRPLGRLPEVTGPYCSQTRSGAAPPDAWLSSCAFAWVMLVSAHDDVCQLFDVVVGQLWARVSGLASAGGWL